MEYLKFANGAEYVCSYFTFDPSANAAYIILDGLSFAETAIIFSDASMVDEISYAGRTFFNYELAFVVKEPSGCKACIKGGRYD